jgi:glycosyltransferase involved in cell wall biosynthesis
MLLSAIFRIPHLYDMHSSLPQQLANFQFGNVRPVVEMFSWLERRVIRTAHSVITIGPDLERHVRSIYPEARQELIENMPLRLVLPATGARVENPPALRQRLGLEGKQVIVYSGTFEPYQGLDLLVASAAAVVREAPEAVFLMIGGKPRQVEHFRSQAERQGLGEGMRFLGTLPVEETLQYLELGDILVSPRIQGTSVPLKVYTYLHMGKPILATRLPPHTMVLDDSTALLVEPEVAAFTGGLLALIRNPELRQQIGQRGQALAREKFDAASYLEKLRRVYQGLEANAPAIKPAPEIKKAGGD